MAHADTLRTQLLTAAVPFVLAAAQTQGVRRIALIGSLTTTKVDPKDVDLLLSVDDAMDLVPLATASRKLRGQVTTLTHGNYGADLFVASSQQHYLGRLCVHRDCPGFRICEAAHCGRRPYLRDDLASVTLERALVVAPPLELWPTIIARVAIPKDVEQYLVQPLLAQLGIGRSEQIIPHGVRDQLIRQDGTVDQMVLAALREAATFLEIALTENSTCSLIEIAPLERYGPRAEIRIKSGHGYEK